MNEKLYKLYHWLAAAGLFSEASSLSALISKGKALDKVSLDHTITLKTASSDYWDFHIKNTPSGWPSSNFSPEDLMSKGNNRVKIYKPALLALDQVASSQPSGKPVRLTSQSNSSKNGAYRDKKFNAQVGGASGSWHVHGKAFDIDVSDYDKDERLTLLRALVDAGFIGFGHGRGVIHADMGRKRFWTYGGYKKPDEESYRGGSGGAAPPSRPPESPMDINSCESEDLPPVGMLIGSEGSGVKFVQRILETLGYLEEADVDCKFGNKTKESLMALQTDSQITPSGEVDKETLLLLKSLHRPSMGSEDGISLIV